VRVLYSILWIWLTVDLSADMSRAVAADVLGLYIAWRAASILMGREHLSAAGKEVVKKSFWHGP